MRLMFIRKYWSPGAFGIKYNLEHKIDYHASLKSWCRRFFKFNVEEDRELRKKYCEQKNYFVYW